MSESRDQLYDKRTINRNIRAGLISDKAYQKYLASLPDSEANAQVVRISASIEGPSADDETLASEAADRG